MDIDKIKAVFSLFTGEEYDERFDPLIELSAMETGKLLIDEESAADPRVPFLCAAMANYRYQLMRCSAERSDFTYAGKVSTADQKRTLEFAERMLREYHTLSRDILKTNELVFMSFSGRSDING